MQSLEKIAANLPDGKIENIWVGSNWSAVVLETQGQRRCGLASNPEKGLELDLARQEAVKRYKERSAKQLIQLVLDQDKLLPGVGMAAINALMPQSPQSWVSRNAGDLISEKGRGKHVTLVGHFPFIPDIRKRVDRLDVLELRPRPGDLHANLAPKIIPQAEVVAITSMAYVNGTMENLLALCPKDAYIIILGPSTPLSPYLFSLGVDLLCGSIVEKIDPVCSGVMAGESFQQIKKRGVRLVAIERPAN